VKRSAPIIVIVIAGGLLAACATQTRRGFAPGGVAPTTSFEGDPYVFQTVDADKLSQPIERLDSIPLPPKKARIVVVRPGDSQTLLKMAIGDNGQLMGLVENHGCLVWDRDPGSFTFKAGFGFHPSAENISRKDAWTVTGNIALEIDNPSKQITVSAPAGKVQYILIKGYVDLSKRDPFGMDVSALPPDSAQARGIECPSVRYSKNTKL
jgi:hypothetical protein